LIAPFTALVFLFHPDKERGLGVRAIINQDILARSAIWQVLAIQNLPGAPVSQTGSDMFT
jgi:hypothetical protein